MIEPAARSRTGEEIQQRVTGKSEAPRTPMELAWRDFVYSEVWTRPGLNLRARFLISLAGAASSNGPSRILDGYVYGALASGELSLGELREAALHLAVYTGWLRGVELDDSITRVANSLEMAEPQHVLLQTDVWDPQNRIREGIAEFENVMGFPAPIPSRPISRRASTVSSLPRCGSGPVWISGRGAGSP